MQPNHTKLRIRRMKYQTNQRGRKYCTLYHGIVGDVPACRVMQLSAMVFNSVFVTKSRLKFAVKTRNNSVHGHVRKWVKTFGGGWRKLVWQENWSLSKIGRNSSLFKEISPKKYEPIVWYLYVLIYIYCLPYEFSLLKIWFFKSLKCKGKKQKMIIILIFLTISMKYVWYYHQALIMQTVVRCYWLMYSG